MAAERGALYSFVFFLVTSLISLSAITYGQSRQSVFSVPMVSMNLHGYTNKILNKEILPGLQRASYTYLAMAAYFGRADVALPGFAKYFRSASERELENANFVMSYINTRGGYVDCRDIVRPDSFSWGNGIDALNDALKLERRMNKDLLDLHKVATNKGDAHMKHILEDRFLEQKVTVIKELADHLAVLESMRGAGYGLGEYVFDRNL